MSRFEWLAEQIQTVKTRNFFVVDGPVDRKFKKQIETSDLGMPASYKDFVIQFGNARLYRSRDQHMVEVFAGPREAESAEGEALWHFGKTDLGPLYFKKADCKNEHGGIEVPVWEWSGQQGLSLAAPSFEVWLKAECDLARRQFKKKKWAEIVSGPPPFSTEEEAIIAARRKIEWKLVEITPGGDLLIDVFNGSDRTLPFLSIGVRGREHPLRGGIWLNIGHVGPGERRMVKRECYKGIIPPEQVILLEEEDPAPETRDRYWEFKPLGGS